ncbi:hypothetical protein IL306_013342 [Fusarium sp. DS 682]|nr:hypothetical protein IL306_013342 [Fusarium sp. DS 682]
MPKRRFIGDPEDDQSKEIIRLGYYVSPTHQHQDLEETSDSFRRVSVSNPPNEVEAEVSPEEPDEDMLQDHLPVDAHNQPDELDDYLDDEDTLDSSGLFWEGPPPTTLEDAINDIERLYAAMNTLERCRDYWKSQVLDLRKYKERLEEMVEVLEAKLIGINKESSRT